MLRPSPQGRVDGVTWGVSPMAEITLKLIAVHLPKFLGINESSFNHNDDDFKAKR
jgi:hypothetical protein